MSTDVMVSNGRCGSGLEDADEPEEGRGLRRETSPVVDCRIPAEVLCLRGERLLSGMGDDALRGAEDLMDMDEFVSRAESSLAGKDVEELLRCRTEDVDALEDDVAVTCEEDRHVDSDVLVSLVQGSDTDMETFANGEEKSRVVEDAMTTGIAVATESSKDSIARTVNRGRRNRG